MNKRMAKVSYLFLLVALISIANAHKRFHFVKTFQASADVSPDVQVPVQETHVVHEPVPVPHQQEVVSKTSYTLAPEVVNERTVQEAPIVHKTVIEKTIIPQYVEKTIRVPTIEEHKVRVPLQPQVHEQTYTHPPDVHHHVPEPAPVPVHYPSVPAHPTYVAPTHQVGVRKHVYASVGKNPQFYNDVFNIPIQTLGAVNKLLNGFLGGGAQAHVSVSKQYSAH